MSIERDLPRPGRSGSTDPQPPGRRDVRDGDPSSAMSVRAKGIAVYLAIAFLGVWPYLYFVRLVLGWSLVNPLVQLPVAFIPAIGAYVVRRRNLP